MTQDWMDGEEKLCIKTDGIVRIKWPAKPIYDKGKVDHKKRLRGAVRCKYDSECIIARSGHCDVNDKTSPDYPFEINT